MAAARNMRPAASARKRFRAGDIQAGVGRFAQRAAREQQILPGLGLVGGRAQQIRRMVGDDERRAAVAMHAIAQARYRGIDAEQRARRALAERDDQRRCDELDLPVEIRPARRRFVRFGRAVPGRPAFQHVGDEDVVAARKPECREHVVEQLPGGADERLALRIFVGAGRFADEHPRGIDGADAGDRMRSRGGEPAGRASRRCPPASASNASEAMRRIAHRRRRSAASRRTGASRQLAQHVVPGGHSRNTSSRVAGIVGRRSQRITSASSRMPWRSSAG